MALGTLTLGATIQAEPILAELRAAQAEPRKEPTVRRMYLNHWVPRAARRPWIDVAAWDACQVVSPDLLEQLEGQQCWAGLDLSSTRDISALSLWFPLPDGTAVALVYLWVTAEAGLTKDQANADRYAACSEAFAV